MEIVMDMETRGTVDLTKCGVYKYAKDPNTDILCISVKVEGFDPYCWNLTQETHEGRALQDIAQADIIHAHNANFERVMWLEKMVKMYGFPHIPFEKWRCTAAKAAAMALPRDLDRACRYLKLPITKSFDGHKLMMKMCKPRKPKTQRRKQPDGTWKITELENPNELYWHETQEDMSGLMAYCNQDVEAEYALNEKIPDLSSMELAIWQHDQLVNDRGIYADRRELKNIIDKIKENKKKLLAELSKITHGAVRSTTQTQATKAYLEEWGILLPNMQKETVLEALETRELPEEIRRILEIRQILSKSSVAKYEAMVRRQDEDQRMRGTLLYHGANTGRWAGRGLQPHNFPRDCWKNPKEMISTFYNSVIEDYEGTAWDVTQMASLSLRGVLQAAPGHQLYCADFSAIEARVLAWLAGEQHVIDTVTTGLDLYKVTAALIYHVVYEEVTEDMRNVGKTCVLALGYQGWLGAFTMMARSYGVSYPKHLREALHKKVWDHAVQTASIPEELNKNKQDGADARRIVRDGVTERDIFETWARPIIENWRASHTRITDFWYKANDAAVKAVLEPGKVFDCGPVLFGMRKDFLHCRLPSNRLLSYYEPKVEQITDKYKRTKPTVGYMTINSETNQWERQYGYGGKWVENITQAVARDLLAEAMLRCEKAGYTVVLHVHDEIVAEISNRSSLGLEEFYELMTELPEWAKDCPVTANGWKGNRYRK